MCTSLRARLAKRAQGAQHNTFLCTGNPTLRIAHAHRKPIKKVILFDYFVASKAMVVLPMGGQMFSPWYF